MEKRLKGQVAVVTGASSGIGLAVAHALCDAGARVCVNYLKEPGPAEEAVREMQSRGGDAFAVRADVSREDDVERMFDETLKRCGRLDIVVSNSGIQKDAALTEMKLEQWNAVLGVNLTGGFLCARRAAREFKRQGVQENISRAAGKIVFVSSVHDVIPWAGHANYAASKGGISMFMKTIAQELAPGRVRVNAISPGAIKTAINEAAWKTPEAEKKLLELIPYGRVGVGEDIAKAAVWLCSDEADYVTGATLYVDGGMTLYPGFADNG